MALKEEMLIVLFSFEGIRKISLWHKSMWMIVFGSTNDTSAKSFADEMKKIF